MSEDYGYKAWDKNPEQLTDEEIENTIHYANTMTGIFCGNEPMDEWEKEHIRLIARHDMTWDEYRPLHMKHIIRKNNINISDEAIEAMYCNG